MVTLEWKFCLSKEVKKCQVKLLTESMMVSLITSEVHDCFNYL